MIVFVRIEHMTTLDVDGVNWLTHFKLRFVVLVELI